MVWGLKVHYSDDIRMVCKSSKLLDAFCWKVPTDWCSWCALAFTNVHRRIMFLDWCFVWLPMDRRKMNPLSVWIPVRRPELTKKQGRTGGWCVSLLVSLLVFLLVSLLVSLLVLLLVNDQHSITIRHIVHACRIRNSLQDGRWISFLNQNFRIKTLESKRLNQLSAGLHGKLMLPLAHTLNKTLSLSLSLCLKVAAGAFEGKCCKWFRLRWRTREGHWGRL